MCRLLWCYIKSDDFNGGQRSDYPNQFYLPIHSLVWISWSVVGFTPDLVLCGTGRSCPVLFWKMDGEGADYLGADSKSAGLIIR